MGATRLRAAQFDRSSSRPSDTEDTSLGTEGTSLMPAGITITLILRWWCGIITQEGPDICDACRDVNRTRSFARLSNVEVIGPWSRVTRITKGEKELNELYDRLKVRSRGTLD